MARKNTKKERERIRKDLLDQLERNGTTGQYYISMVDDYIRFWETKNALLDDIEKRGAVVAYVSNSGVENQKKNESIAESVKVSERMSKLLVSMGIEPGQVMGLDDEM